MDFGVGDRVRLEIIDSGYVPTTVKIFDAAPATVAMTMPAHYIYLDEVAIPGVSEPGAAVTFELTTPGGWR